MYPVCAHYLMGSCPFGNRCRNSHDSGSLDPRNHDENTLSVPATGIVTSVLTQPQSLQTNNAARTLPRRPPFPSVARLDDEVTVSETVSGMDFTSVRISSLGLPRIRPRRPPFTRIPQSADDDETLPVPINGISVRTTSASSPTWNVPRTRPRRPTFQKIPRLDDEQTGPVLNMRLDLTSMQIRSSTTPRTRPRRPPFPGLVETRSQNGVNSERPLLNSSLNSNSEETILDMHAEHTSYNGNNESTIKQQLDQFITNIETELRCNICFGIFTKPTVLNCSHVFCYQCIETWSNNVNQCPLCRQTVTNKIQCLPLERFLSNVTSCLPK